MAAAAPSPTNTEDQVDPEDVVGELDEELVCTLCTAVLRQPHSCQAGHTFCKDCIAEWLGRSHTCPVDRAPLVVETLTRQRPMENMISRLTVRCPHHGGRQDGQPAKKLRRVSQPDDGGPSEPHAPEGNAPEDNAAAGGCGWTGKMCERAAHLADVCEFARKLCKHAGCGQRIQFAEVAAHEAACAHLPVTCEHCGESRTANTIRFHNCPRAPVDCPFNDCGCHVRPPRAGVDRHLTTHAVAHARLTTNKLRELERQLAETRTAVRHKMTWTVGGIATKVQAGSRVFSPALTMDVGGGTVDIAAFLDMTILNDEQHISVFLSLRRCQNHLLPLVIGGTELTVEGATREGTQSKRKTFKESSAFRALHWSKGFGHLLKVQDFANDEIKVSVDLVIERKATVFATT